MRYCFDAVSVYKITIKKFIPEPIIRKDVVTVFLETIDLTTVSLVADILSCLRKCDLSENVILKQKGFRIKLKQL